MIEVGRLCIKIAGREAGKKCVIVDILEKNYVLIDGDVRRKKCNISHLEPLEQKIEIRKKAGHEDIVKEFKKQGIDITEKKSKEKKEKPRKLRKKDRRELEEKEIKEKPKKETKPKEKKETKKEIKTEKKETKANK